jgi:hypothetical protein
VNTGQPALPSAHRSCSEATLALEHVDEPQVDGDTDAEHRNDGDGGAEDASELADGDVEDSDQAP